jgi:hypothetical protein
MREKFSLVIDRSLSRELVNNEINAAEFLTRLFGDKSSQNYHTMCEGLVAYHNKEGGSPEITQFEITDCGFKAESTTGFLKCKFSIHFHYTCSDVHNDARDIIRWDFKLDKYNNLIHFTGEEPWVRDAE